MLHQLVVGDFTRPVTTDWAREIADPLLRDDLSRCFAGNPQERFAGASQLAMHLRGLPKRQAALAEQQLTLAAAAKAAYLRGVVRTAALASLVVAALAYLAIFAFQKAKEESRQRRLVRQILYAADMNLAQQALGGNNRGRAEELLNRQKPKNKSEIDLRGWEWRYLWQDCQSDALYPLCQKSNSIWSLAVSHDARWLAVGEYQSGGLSVWDLQRRQKVRRLAEGEGRVVAAFSPRAPLLAFSVEPRESTYRQNQGSVWLWDCTTRQIVTNLPLGGICRGLAFSRDGETLATFTQQSESALTLWRVPEGRRLKTYPIGLTQAGVGAGFAVADDLSIAAYTASAGSMGSSISLAGTIGGSQIRPTDSRQPWRYHPMGNSWPPPRTRSSR
jgi:type II secretory pathway pseudopilin PulG